MNEFEQDVFEQDVLDVSRVIEFPQPAGRYDNVCCASKEITQQLLFSAYMQGVFPWFDEDSGDPVLWYSPDPRFCLKTSDLHIPSSLKKFLKHTPYTYTMDKAFSKVILECRNMARPGQNGTWIGKKIMDSYTKFHENGFAHSVECWKDGELAGGFYGVLIGSVFCGESMFTKLSDSSKSAFALFAECFRDCGGQLIDSQVYTDNIARYGAKNISRQAFLYLEKEYLYKPLEKNLKVEFEKLCSSVSRTV